MKRVKGAKDYYSIPWEEMVYYDPTSPTGLRHKRDIVFGNQKTMLKAKAGDTAGSLTQEGYYVFCSSRYGTFQIHRIIWILLNKKDIPCDCVIDHIDGVRTNNNAENLRVLYHKDNGRNATMYKNNTTGKVGVYFDTKKDKKGVPRHYWKSSWMELDGKQKTKCFSVEKLGIIPAQYLASQHRDAQIARLNSEGADYTDRHGK